MRYFLSVIFFACASTAQAHSGHLADVAGHDHWVAGVAIGLAILTGIYGALKGRKETSEAESSDAEDHDDEGIPA